MYESHSDALLSRERFIVRMLRHAAGAAALVLGSLGIGMAGYVYFERLSWIDAFLNSAMLLGGMGPIDTPRTVGVVFAPILHRALHKFHWRKDTAK